MGKYKRLGINTIQIFLGNIGSKVISIVMMPFYTTWLTVSDYGLTDILNVYASLLLSVVTCCICESIFIFPKGEDKNKQADYFSSGLLFVIIALFLTAIVFNLTRFFADVYNLHNSFIDHVWLIHILLASQVIQFFIQQFTRSIDKILIYSTTGIIVTLISAVLAFILIPRYGVYGYIYSLVISNIVGTIYSFIAAKLYDYIIIPASCRKTTYVMLKYSMPLVPNSIMWWLVNALNRPLLEENLGFHEIGLFAVANKFPGVITMIFSIFISSWQISVIEEFGKDGYSYFYNTIFKVIFYGLATMVLVMVVVSPWLVELFTTPEYYDAWFYIPLLSLGAVFSSLSSLCGSTFNATRESKYFLYSSVWGAISAIILNFILIPLYGIWGASFSTFASFLVMTLSRIIYSWRYVKINKVFQYVLTLALLLITILLRSFMSASTLWIVAFSITFVLIICFLHKDCLVIYNKIKK